MGILYTATFEDRTVNSLRDVFTLETAVGVPIYIHELVLNQLTIKTVEHLQIKWARDGANVGSGGVTPSKYPWIPAETDAADTTVTADNTTQSATTGTVQIIDDWVLPAEYRVIFQEDKLYPIAGNSQLIVELETVPSVSMTYSGWVLWEEMK